MEDRWFRKGEYVEIIGHCPLYTKFHIGDICEVVSVMPGSPERYAYTLVSAQDNDHWCINEQFVGPTNEF